MTFFQHPFTCLHNPNVWCHTEEDGFLFESPFLSTFLSHVVFRQFVASGLLFKKKQQQKNTHPNFCKAAWSCFSINVTKMWPYACIYRHYSIIYTHTLKWIHKSIGLTLESSLIPQRCRYNWAETQSKFRQAFAFTLIVWRSMSLIDLWLWNKLNSPMGV